MIKIKTPKQIKSSEGFTIIELMIATTIFAVIMIITTTAILGISKTYIQGLVESQNQNTTRRIISEISQDIQYNNQATINIGGIQHLNSTSPRGWFCIGQDVYVVNLDHEIQNSSDFALIRYSSSSCPSSQPAIISGLPPNGSYNKGSVEELLTSNQQLSRFSILYSTNGYYSVSTTVAYGNDFMPGPAVAKNGLIYECNTSSYGLNFCSISSLTNSVEPIINN